MSNMGLHVLVAEAVVAAPRDEVWDFFADPRNLARMTPPEMRLEDVPLGGVVPDRIRPGLLVAHRVRPLAGIPMIWLSEITQVVEGERFIDEQRMGPYALWHHEHEFRDEPGGGTRVTDRVTYAMPFGPLGELVRPFLVVPALAKAFAYREEAMRRVFPITR